MDVTERWSVGHGRYAKSRGNVDHPEKFVRPHRFVSLAAAGLTLLLLVDHAAIGKGMAEALESIMTTDTPVFDDARTRMAQSLDRPLAAGTAAATVRGDVTGRTLLRAMGGICEMRATEGWQREAQQITAILFDGLRRSGTVTG